MKNKIIILLSFFCVLTTCGYSQYIKSVGLKDGVILASQKWNYLSMNWTLDNQYRYGIDCGLSIEWIKESPVTLLTELHYLQKGMKDKVMVTTAQNPDGTGEYKTLLPEVNYLSIPILAKYSMNYSSLSVYGLAGTRIDYLLSTKGDGFDVVINKFKKIDFGGSFGIGVEKNSSLNNAFGFELRYSPNFTESYSTSLLNVSNHSFEILFVVLF